MARREKDAAINFRGKIGNIVGVRWRGMDVLRSAPRKTTKAPTEKQLLQRAKFSEAVRILTPLREVLMQFYGPEPAGKTRYNAALSYTVSRVVEARGENLLISPARIMPAKGELTALANAAASTADGLNYKVTWQDNSEFGNASPGDVLHYAVVAADFTGAFCRAAAAVRADGNASVAVNDFFKDKACLFYAWLVSSDGKLVSNSEYLGEFVATQ